MSCSVCISGSWFFLKMFRLKIPSRHVFEMVDNSTSLIKKIQTDMMFCQFWCSCSWFTHVRFITENLSHIIHERLMWLLPSKQRNLVLFDWLGDWAGFLSPKSAETNGHNPVLYNSLGLLPASASLRTVTSPLFSQYQCLTASSCSVLSWQMRTDCF